MTSRLLQSPHTPALSPPAISTILADNPWRNCWMHCPSGSQRPHTLQDPNRALRRLPVLLSILTELRCFTISCSGPLWGARPIAARAHLRASASTCGSSSGSRRCIRCRSLLGVIPQLHTSSSAQSRHSTTAIFSSRIPSPTLRSSNTAQGL